MAKNIHIGINGIARRVKNIYIGVGSKARKVKKVYIGVGGVARPVFPRTELQLYGAITSLSQGRHNIAAVGTSDGSGYALFAGGHNGSAYSAVVDVYNTGLTRTTGTALSQARRYHTEAKPQYGDTGYLVTTQFTFAGGLSASGYSNVVDQYSASLSRTTMTTLSVARELLAGTAGWISQTFAGGENGSNLATVDHYSVGTRSTITSLAQARHKLASAKTSSYSLFAGGYQGAAHSAVVDAYNSDNVRTNPSGLYAAADCLAGVNNGGNALFAGGSGSGVYRATVTAYNNSLVRSRPADLSQARQYVTATTIDGFTLFAGGEQGAGLFSNVVDVYDSSLVKRESIQMTQARRWASAASVGNFGLVAGGYLGSWSNRVDAYTVG